jgi:hypothetical protein
MFSFLLMPACAVVLYLVAFAVGEARSRIIKLLFFGYFLRMVAQFVARNVPIFNGIAGGDSILYEMLASQIRLLWEHQGLHFVLDDEIPAVGQASLPVNLFALIIRINDGPAPEGCIAVLALSACLSALNLFKLARELGLPERISYRLTAVFLFMPAFVFHTSDMYKDGLVLFFALGAVGSAIRLSRKFTMLHSLVGAVSLIALWYVRTYMVFASLAPLVVGLVGLNTKSLLRPLMMFFAMAVVFIFASTYTHMLDQAGEAANLQYTIGTSANVLSYGDKTGSGVRFDDGGSVYGALYLKVIYTLIAPFPWQAGSFGFHVGKIDALISVYAIYRSALAIRMHWREHRGTILTLLAFIIPMTFAYAVGLYNIGLVLRQRMPIVSFLLLLGALSWVPRGQLGAVHEDDDEDDEDDEDVGEDSDSDVEDSDRDVVVRGLGRPRLVVR